MYKSESLVTKTLINMEKVSKQALLHVANLTIPSVQVIVVNGNIGCSFCRQRVSQVVSKISGLKEYTVDFRNKQVIAKGDVKPYSADRRFVDKRKKKSSSNKKSAPLAHQTSFQEPLGHVSA